MHPRRAYTALVAAADLEGMRASASVLLGQRDALPGSPHAPSTPHQESLLAAGYPCREDLPDVATDPAPDEARAALVEELVRHGLTPTAAAEVAASL